MSPMKHNCTQKKVITFTKHDIEKWRDDGKIPFEAIQLICDHFQELFDSTSSYAKDLQAMYPNNIQSQISTHSDKSLFESIISTLLKSYDTPISKPVNALFREINLDEEFGVSRQVADHIYLVPQMIKNCKVEWVFENIYMLRSEGQNSKGDSITLEHRFKAKNEQDAHEYAQEYIHNLTNRQNKTFLACWKFANTIGKNTFTCKLTELMEQAYPNQDSYFSTKDKVTFYQDLLDLESTKFIITKRYRKYLRKKETITSFIIPLIQIYRTEQEVPLLNKEEPCSYRTDSYPNDIFLSVLPNPTQDAINDINKETKLRFIGTSFKNKTLELPAKDIQLAEIIQIRKSQNKSASYISFNKEYLFHLAHLEKTYEKNTTKANKSLLKKLQKLCELNIIKACPEKIERVVNLQVR